MGHWARTGAGAMPARLSPAASIVVPVFRSRACRFATEDVAAAPLSGAAALPTSNRPRSPAMKFRLVTLAAMLATGSAQALTPQQIDADRANGTLKEVVVHGGS